MPLSRLFPPSLSLSTSRTFATLFRPDVAQTHDLSPFFVHRCIILIARIIARIPYRVPIIKPFNLVPCFSLHFVPIYFIVHGCVTCAPVHHKIIRSALHFSIYGNFCLRETVFTPNTGNGALLAFARQVRAILTASD